MTARTYKEKEIIFSQGDAADAVFYVESGAVKLTVVCEKEKKAVIAFLRPGSFLGEGSLGGQSLRIYTARSVGQSRVARLGKRTITRTLKRNPKFAKMFHCYLLSRILRMEEDLIDQFFNFSERRLARVLYLLGQVIGDSTPGFIMKVSQSTLAEMVGTTRARISGFMTGFKKRGFVRYNGGLQINREAIAEFLLESTGITQPKKAARSR